MNPIKGFRQRTTHLKNFLLFIQFEYLLEHMLLVLLVGHHVAREGLQWNDLGRKESRIIEGKLKKGKIKLQ